MKVTELTLPFRVKRPMLALGADMKGAFALAKGDKAILVDGFGDLGEINNFVRYEKAIKRYGRDFGIKPKTVACDMHPGYFSTRFAEKYKPYKVQHHEAHIASAIIDNGIKGDVIGVAFDGTGFGPDGNIWGGEFFVGGLKGFKRAAHLKYMPMPGGDMAVREAWRMAVSYLYSTYGGSFIDLKIDFMKNFNRKRWRRLKEMIDRGINSPLTSSAGRLFDAVGSIILAKHTADFEAELPVSLEKIIEIRCDDSYSFDVNKHEGAYILDVKPLIRGVVADLSGGIDAAVISAKFHNTIRDMIVKISLNIRKRFKTAKVVFSGGVFQNRHLTAGSSSALKKRGFEVYLHSNIPTNDSGIPIGQLAIVNARFRGQGLSPR